MSTCSAGNASAEAGSTELERALLSRIESSITASLRYDGESEIREAISEAVKTGSELKTLLFQCVPPSHGVEVSSAPIALERQQGDKWAGHVAETSQQRQRDPHSLSCTTASLLLARAALLGRCSEVGVLIHLGALPNVVVCGRWSAMCLAVLGGHDDAVQLLIDEGAAVDSVQARSPSITASLAHASHLNKREAPPAAPLSDPASAPSEQATIPVVFPAPRSADDGAREWLKSMISPDSSIAASFRAKSPPPHLPQAARGGQSEPAIVRHVAEGGVPTLSNIPLQVALWHPKENCSMIAKLLTDAGASPCAEIPLDEGDRAPSSGMMRNNKSNSMSMISLMPRAPLIATASGDGLHPEFARISMGRRLTMHDDSSSPSTLPLLHLAVAEERILAVQVLLRLGADPSQRAQNCATYAGSTPLHIACIGRKAEGLTRYSSMSGESDSAASIAVMVKELLQKGADPRIVDASQRTPLLVAVECGQESAVEALVEFGDPGMLGLDVKKRYSGETPLHIAVLEGHVRAVEALLRAGADQSVRTEDGRTVLSCAVQLYRHLVPPIAGPSGSSATGSEMMARDVDGDGKNRQRSDAQKQYEREKLKARLRCVALLLSEEACEVDSITLLWALSHQNNGALELMLTHQSGAMDMHSWTEHIHPSPQRYLFSDVSLLLSQAIPPCPPLVRCLTSLDLSSNALDRLPAALLQLRALNTLILAHNRFTCSIDSTEVLMEADPPHTSSSLVSSTSLGERSKPKQVTSSDHDTAHARMFWHMHIPASVRTLDLSHNRLEHVPSHWISALPLLHTLNLKKNRLTRIPATLFAIKSLRSLILSGNNFAVLDEQELISSDGVACCDRVMSYLDSYLDDDPETGLHSVELSIKVVMVGQECAGKTSLLHALKSSSHVSSVTSPLATDGIDIEHVKVESTKADASDPYEFDIELKLWDFAGQDTYYAVHHLFLTPDALYIVLWDIQLLPDEARVSFWLSSVRTRAPNAKILLVATHADKVTSKALRNKVIHFMRKRYVEKFENVVDVVLVSSTSGFGVRELKNSLYSLARQHARHIPVCYQLLLDRLKERHKQWQRTHAPDEVPVMSWGDLEAIGRCCGFVEQNDKLFRAARALHNLGEVVHLIREQEGDLLFFDAPWLIRCMSSIVSLRHNYCKSGILYHSDLPHVWAEAEFPSAMHAKLLELLEEYEIAQPLSADPRRGARHLIPCLLSPHRPHQVLRDWAVSNVISPPSSAPDSAASSPSSPFFLSPPTTPVKFTSPSNSPASSPGAGSAGSSSGTAPLPSTVTMPRFSGVELLREYALSFVPSGLIGRLLVRGMSQFSCASIWSKGAIFYRSRKRTRLGRAAWLDARKGSFAPAQTPPPLAASMGLIEQYGHVQLPNALVELDEEERIIRILTRGHTVIETAEMMLALTGVVDSLVHHWYHIPSVNVTVPCPGCLSTLPSVTASYLFSPVPSCSFEEGHISTEPYPLVEAGLTVLGGSSSRKVAPRSTPRMEEEVDVSCVYHFPLAEIEQAVMDPMLTLSCGERSAVCPEPRRTTVSSPVSPLGASSIADADVHCRSHFSCAYLAPDTALVDLYAHRIDAAALRNLRPLSTIVNGSVAEQFGVLEEHVPKRRGASEAKIFRGELDGRAVFVKVLRSTKPADTLSGRKSSDAKEPPIVVQGPESPGSRSPGSLKEVEDDGWIVKFDTSELGEDTDSDLDRSSSPPMPALEGTRWGYAQLLAAFQEFRSEVRLMHELQNPSVVRLEGFCISFPLIMVLEYAPGGDLYQTLNDPCGVLAMVDAVLDAQQELDGIALDLEFQRYNSAEELEGARASAEARATFWLSVIERVCIIMHAVADGREVEGEEGAQIARVHEGDGAPTWNTLSVDNLARLAETLMQFVSASRERLARTSRETDRAVQEARARVKDAHVASLAPLPLLLLLRLALDISRAIAFLHSQDPPIIHRDIKSPNCVLMSPPSTLFSSETHSGIIAKLADFGFSSPLYTPALHAGGTLSDQDVNLPTWLAPEVFDGARDDFGASSDSSSEARAPRKRSKSITPSGQYTTKSDTYALGMVIWELMARRHPFHDVVDGEVGLSNLPREDLVRAAVLRGARPEIPSNYPASLASLVQQCWNQSAHLRPTATDVQRRLVLILGEELPSSAQYPWAQREARSRPFSTVPSGGWTQSKTLAKSPNTRRAHSSTSESITRAQAPPGTFTAEKLLPSTVCSLSVINNQMWGGCRDGALCVFDITNARCLIRLHRAHEQDIHSIEEIRSLSGPDTMVWTASSEGSVKCWNPAPSISISSPVWPDRKHSSQLLAVASSECVLMLDTESLRCVGGGRHVESTRDDTKTSPGMQSNGLVFTIANSRICAVVPWQSDESAARCSRCENSFGRIVTHRHHCWQCGCVVCSQCASEYSKFTAASGQSHACRICPQCSSDLAVVDMLHPLDGKKLARPRSSMESLSRDKPGSHGYIERRRSKEEALSVRGGHGVVKRLLTPTYLDMVDGGDDCTTARFSFSVLLDSGDRLVFAVKGVDLCRRWVHALLMARQYSIAQRRGAAFHSTPCVRLSLVTPPISCLASYDNVLWVGEGTDSGIRTHDGVTGASRARHLLHGPAAGFKVAAMEASARYQLMFAALHTFIYAVSPRDGTVVAYWSSHSSPITRLSVSRSSFAGRVRLWSGCIDGTMCSWSLHRVAAIHGMRSLSPPPSPLVNAQSPSEEAEGRGAERDSLNTLKFRPSPSGSPIVSIKHTSYVMWVATEDGCVRAWNESTLCYAEGMELQSPHVSAVQPIGEQWLWVCSEDRTAFIFHHRR